MTCDETTDLVARDRLRRDAGSRLSSVWLAAHHQGMTAGSNERHVFNVVQLPIVKASWPASMRLRPIGGARPDNHK